MVIALKLIVSLVLVALGISTFYYQFWEISRVHTYMMLFAINAIGLGASMAYEFLPKMGWFRTEQIVDRGCRLLRNTVRGMPAGEKSSHGLSGFRHNGEC